MDTNASDTTAAVAAIDCAPRRLAFPRGIHLALALPRFRPPRSLRTRFLLFAILMVGLVVLQGLVSWAVADRNRSMSATTDGAVASLMADLDLLRTIKDMQVLALVTQNKVATASADDPASVRIDLKKVAGDYRTAHATLARIVAERHMKTLGGIDDVGQRVQVAKDSFEALETRALQAADEVAKPDHKVPPALMLEISARVDGLYEHLDRMAEGVSLLAGRDRTGLRDTSAAHGAALTQLTGVMAAAAGIGLLACVAVTLFVLRGILRPLASVAAATHDLAHGILHTHVPEFRAEELWQIGRALTIFRDNLIETGRLRAEREDQEARAVADKKRTMAELAQGFELCISGVVGNVSAAAAQLRTMAQSFSGAAEEASAQANVVAGASELAAGNVAAVASATEELSASIREISQQVSYAAGIADQAVAQTQQTNAIVGSLGEAASHIDTVVNLISDIAGRTNLLALNATIEAARAGDSGKGFAVVAGEVKSLATQTARATAEIGGQIAAVQQASREAIAAIQAISGTIAQIREISACVAAAVEQQGAATAEISQNVQQAAAGTQDVSTHIGGVTQAAQQVGSHASEVLGAATSLSGQSNMLRSEVERFIARVRAS